MTVIRVYEARTANIVCTGRDITGETELQTEVRDARRLDIIGTVASVVAHDLNNLLMVIHAYAELGLQTLYCEHPLRRNLQEALAAARRAADLTRQLLASGRGLVPGVQAVKLNSIIEEACDLLPRVLGEDVKLRLALDEETGWIQADPGQVERALFNLAANARDAMPRGGTFSIKTKPVSIDAKDLPLGSQPLQSRYVLLEAADSGKGIPDEEVSEIFLPFYSTRGEGQGNGLGLAVVERAMRLSGGFIRVESELGKGTSFRLYFPVAEHASRNSAEIKSVTEVPQGTETVLLVEDDDAVRESSAEFLSSVGYTVLSAADGEQALAVASKHRGKIDALVSDVVMPGLNGAELAASLARLQPDLRVVFISGTLNPHCEEKGSKPATKSYASHIRLVFWRQSCVKDFYLRPGRGPPALEHNNRSRIIAASMGLSARHLDAGAAASKSDLVQASHPARLRYISLAIIFLLWCAIYLAGIFSPALLDDVDTIHAEAAREMVARHDWVTLYTDGIRYLEKAPLMYWSTALSYKVFGLSEASTRLPLMLGVLALLLVTYFLGKRAYSERAGLYAAVVLCTCLGPYIFTRFQIPDIIVGLWMALSGFFFLVSLEQEQPSRWVCWGFAATCALDVLTKSLIGLVFPLGAIFLYLLITKTLRHILKLHLVSSTVVFLAIAAPWHVLAARANPPAGEAKGFLWFYFVNEQFLRYIGKRVPAGYDTVPLLIFWVLTILWLAPWMVFLPQSIRNVPLQFREWRDSMSPSQRAGLFFLVWTLVVVGFFTFSTRQEYYTIPAIPALALLVGAWLAKEAKSPESEYRSARISSWVLFTIVLLGSILGIVLLLSSKPPSPGADLADLLKKNPEDYNLALGHFLDLTPEALGMFRLPLIAAVGALLFGSVLNLWLRCKRKPRYGNAILAGMMVALLAAVHAAFATFSPILSSKPLAAAIARHYQPGDVIVIDGQYHEASSLNFYLKTRVRVLHEPSGNLWYGSKFPDAPRVFETPASFAELWSSPTTVFLWTDEEQPKELAGLSHYSLARSGGKSIFVNRKFAP